RRIKRPRRPSRRRIKRPRRPSRRRIRQRRASRNDDRYRRDMRHLLVTNDFPPKVGGIQTYLWELWRRLPPEEFAVLTTAHPDATAFDAAQPFRVERTSGTVLWPTPDLRRRIDRL